MIDQTLTKPIGLIQDLKIHIRGIPYVVTFIVMKNNVLDANNSMLLGCPWLQDGKVTHDWGNNLISIKGNGTICTIMITKHLDSNTKCLKSYFATTLLIKSQMKRKTCCLAAKLDLFTIGTIILPKLEVLAIMLVDGKTDINPKIGTDAKISTNVEINMDPKIDTNTKTDIDMKISTDEPIFDFPHTPREILVDTTLTHIKV